MIGMGQGYIYFNKELCAGTPSLFIVLSIFSKFIEKH